MLKLIKKLIFPTALSLIILFLYTVGYCVLSLENNALSVVVCNYPMVTYIQPFQDLFVA